MYCWVAGPPHAANLDGVKGLTAGNRTAYEIEYRTNPDDTEFEFVPGVGITSYEYHHHGSIAETELHLVEFRGAGGAEAPAFSAAAHKSLAAETQLSPSPGLPRN